MERGHQADAHDAGPFGAKWNGDIELMLMMLAHFGANWKGDIELMLMMLARLGPSGEGTSS